MEQQEIADVLVEAIRALCDEAGIEITSLESGVSEEKLLSYPVSVVAGVMDESGKSRGILISGFSEDTATALSLHISEVFSMGASGNIREDGLQKVLAEFVNMVAGHTVSLWSEMGYRASFTPPLFFIGETKRFNVPWNSRPYTYRTVTPHGPMMFHLCLLEERRARKAERILVVDDSPSIRALMRNILERKGYHVHEAGSASHCVEMFRRLAPDLVTMDLSLPGASGIDTIRMLKEINPDVSVLVVSSISTEELMAKAKKLGAKGYIVKPFHFKELLEAVDQALAQASSSE